MLQPSLAQGSDLDLIGKLLNDPSSTPTYSTSPLSLIPPLLSFGNLSDASASRCFQPALDGVIPPNEYLGLLQKILFPESVLEMRKWIFRPSDSQVWKSGRTKVVIAPSIKDGPTLFAEFQPVVVAHLMARIAQQCFNQQLKQAVGGYLRWGFKQEFILVMGVGSTEPF